MRDLSFDDVQLMLDEQDKDWYREAADKAASPNWKPVYCRPGGMTEAEFIAKRAASRKTPYKNGGGPEHPWRLVPERKVDLTSLAPRAKERPAPPVLASETAKRRFRIRSNSKPSLRASEIDYARI